MKRRKFGLLAGTSLITVSKLRPVRAQPVSPDPALLTTTLTPMGAERAGNADGSIPSWTGGLVHPPLPPDASVAVHLFEDEQPLYTINAGNMTQYAALLTPGTRAQIQKFGMKLHVYQTHRTAAAPQYVYDNTAKNLLNAKLDPAGGRFGFTGAYGGVPFPIIDTSDPLVGGVQLIWNHLNAWLGYSTSSTFNPGCVIINGKLTLAGSTRSHTIYPYYDPDGSLETFGGYYSKGHYYYIAPPSVVGQEVLTWHSTNVNKHPDIVWELLNGQGRVRKAPNEAFDFPNPASDGIATVDESSCFYGNPSQYDWKFVEKREMLVPYNCNKLVFHDLSNVMGEHFLNPELVRWEKHRVWVVEATLHPGIRNINSKRRLYIDEDSWTALLGEGYDANNVMWKAYTVFNQCQPSVPTTSEQGMAVFNLLTGDYIYNGSIPHENFASIELNGVYNAPSLFEPQQMAAQASF